MRRRLLPAYLGTTLLAGALALGLGPSPAVAIEPLTGLPIPDEQIGTGLPAEYMQSITFDLDGDGTRELVTVGTAADAPGVAAVQAWWVDVHGAAADSNQVHVRRAASVDEQLTERGLLGIDREGMVAVKIAEGTQLFVARRGGQRQLFVAGEGYAADDGANPCCLTIWEITHGSGHTINLTLVASTSQTATTIAVADLDADGTDELFVIEGPWTWEGDVPPPAELALLRWNGDRFARRVITLSTPLASALSLNSGLSVVADTDGLPGDDLIFSVWDREGVQQSWIRLTLRDDAFHAETADVGDRFAFNVVLLDTGPALLTSEGNLGERLQLWRWPRDRAMEPQGPPRITGGGPVAVLGTGSDSRIVAASGGFPTTAVVVVAGDLGGGAGPRTEFTRDSRSTTILNDVLDTLPLWEGVLPDGLPGLPDVYVFSGQVVFPVADPRRLAASQQAPLMVGTRPVGSVGPSGTWEVMALNDNEGHYDPGSQQKVVWMFNQPSPGPIWLVASEELTQPEVNGGELTPTFHGAAEDPQRDQTLLVGSDAVEAEVHGPPGTIVHWLTRGVPDGQGEIGPTGSLTIRLLPPASPDAPDGSGATARIWAVTPAGHAYSGSWRLRVYRLPPDLELTVPEGLLVIEPTIVGQTTPGARVTVNGAAAEVSPTGRFQLRVDAGIVPTEFRIVATDPVDNTTTRVVSIVWPLDYRRLPFVPLAVLITVVAGVVLYLRNPDTGPRHRAPDDDATFEEIGG